VLPIDDLDWVDGGNVVAVMAVNRMAAEHENQESQLASMNH
jgi:hypothetical protein